MLKIVWYFRDWKVSKNYQDITTETPSEVCAWEFLRRNIEYQYDFFEYTRTGQFPSYVSHLNELDSTNMCDWYSIDSQSKNFNPHDDTPPIFYIDAKPIFATRRCPDRYLPHEFSARLSVDLDRDTQLKAIKKYFNEFKEKCGAGFSINKENYGIYLQILDALFAGISEDEIVRGHTPICDATQKLETVETYIAQAKALRDRDYIKILKGNIFFPKPEKFKFSKNAFNTI